MQAQKCIFSSHRKKNKNAKEISAPIKPATPQINKKINKMAKTTTNRNNNKQVKLIASFNKCLSTELSRQSCCQSQEKSIFLVNNSKHRAELRLLSLVLYRNNLPLQSSTTADHYTQAALRLWRKNVAS